MLEEALRRETPCSARDVGWRRWSAREVQNMQNPMEDRPKSLDYGSLNEPGRPSVPSSAAVQSVGGAETLADPALQPQTPMTSQENRFFRFRLGSSEADISLSPQYSETVYRSQVPSHPLACLASHIALSPIIDIRYTGEGVPGFANQVRMRAAGSPGRGCREGCVGGGTGITVASTV